MTGSKTVRLAALEIAWFAVNVPTLDFRLALERVEDPRPATSDQAAPARIAR